jgi:predicted alpha-1,2-mannosidase
VPTKLVEYVNILQGTDSNPHFSNGNTLPLVGMPWGMVDWSIQNAVTGWFFHPNGKVDGIRATHEPSPWMGDYAPFVLMPQAGDLRMDAKARAQEYDMNAAVLRPDYEKLDLKQDAIRMELTGTERCGVFRFTYHTGTTGRLIVDGADKSKVDLKIEGRTIYGRAPNKNFPSYFVVKLDRDIIKSEILKDEASQAADSKAIPKAIPDGFSTETRGYVEFMTQQTEPVIVKVGTSFISWEQAEQNLNAETEGAFDAVHDRVAGVWNANLGKIEITATEDQKRTFYSCLYRAQMFPHRLYELDAAGKAIHRSPYDGKIHDGVLYGDIGIWDGFRTTFPLITLLYPGQLDEILQGFVNASVEGDGTMPEWPSPGYRKCMIGQHCAAIFADALVKGHKNYDVDKAYASLRRSAFEPPAKGMLVRDGMEDYLSLGYSPSAKHSVSTTLDYAYDDWCVAQMARLLNHPDDAKSLMARSQNYRKLWDPTVGFMRGKNADGTWVEPFDEFAWGGPYVESGPWQASWFVPHDPAGQTNLLGGRESFAAKLDKLFSQPPTYHLGGYKSVIQEMNGMVAINFGQCNLNNQPSFCIPYLYAAIGLPSKTQYWTRRACAELFNAGPKGFPGDEDDGSMASWYIFSCLGFYPFCPGTTEYLVTSPAFPKAIIHLAGDKTLVISASANSDNNIYIQKHGCPVISSTIAVG